MNQRRLLLIVVCCLVLTLGGCGLFMPLEELIRRERIEERERARLTLIQDCERVVPPEVLAQMDRRIVDGRRPVFYYMGQEDVFHGDKREILHADAVRFDFDSGDLSSVQRERLRQWLHNGRRTVFLEGDEIKEFSWLIPGIAVHPVAQSSMHRQNTLLRKHPVNTDCEAIRFHSTMTAVGRLPQGSEVVVRAAQLPDGWPEDAGETAAIVCSFPVGKSTVYFSERLGDAPDNSRWLLNFYHWMLGKPIPPPTVVRGDQPAE